MKTQREKFEDWMKDILEYADFRKKRGEYICPHMQNDWSLWQAAIESVVVELPCWSEYDTPRQAIDACAERIEAAGVIVNDRP